MVIDTSALVAIALRGPTRQRLLDVIGSASLRIISAMSLLEAGMVLRARWGEAGLTVLDRVVGELVNEVVPFDEIQARRPLPRLRALEKGWGIGRSSISETAPCMRWRHCEVSRCWRRATISRPRISASTRCSDARAGAEVATAGRLAQPRRPDGLTSAGATSRFQI